LRFVKLPRMHKFLKKQLPGRLAKYLHIQIKFMLFPRDRHLTNFGLSIPRMPNWIWKNHYLSRQCNVE